MNEGGFRGETNHNSLRKDNVYLCARHVHACTPLRNLPDGDLESLGTTAMTDIPSSKRNKIGSSGQRRVYCHRCPPRERVATKLLTLIGQSATQLWFGKNSGK